MLVLLSLLCVAAATSPLSTGSEHEAMCCVDGKGLLAAHDEGTGATLEECETRPLNKLQQHVYGLVFGQETLLRARTSDGRSLFLRLFDDAVTARHYGASPHHTWSRGSLVVCTYNVWNFNAPYRTRLVAIARLLETAACDVMLLQEMRMRWTFHHVTFIMADLARHFPGFSYDFQPAMAYLESRSFDTEGLAVMTRLPLLGVHVLDLSNNATLDSDDGHARIFMRATVALSSAVSLDMHNTHMSLSRAARVRNGREIVAQLNSRTDVAQFLAGDLNAEPDDALYEMLAAELSDIGSCGLTFPTWNVTKRIDFVMGRRLESAGLRVVSATTFGAADSAETAPSDHQGIRVEFATSHQAREEL